MGHSFLNSMLMLAHLDLAGSGGSPGSANCTANLAGSPASRDVFRGQGSTVPPPKNFVGKCKRNYFHSLSSIFRIKIFFHPRNFFSFFKMGHPTGRGMGRKRYHLLLPLNIIDLMGH